MSALAGLVRSSETPKKSAISQSGATEKNRKEIKRALKELITKYKKRTRRDIVNLLQRLPEQLPGDDGFVAAGVAPKVRSVTLRDLVRIARENAVRENRLRGGREGGE